ncbi:probable serine/threonine-protein kinase DDB_G0278845 isoform X4 [Bradysia coprophila]|uniref:probable serine/threonine-protein kinase DDB_G0278845 isoform X4 n=1 Tax=Bradysia coprophila TaxID=38358 RepID=UPI00187DA5B4|nr:probable serine/threonine-protein kinase DDB_G0278845 isoform X4 [Bradysia coprophila]
MGKCVSKQTANSRWESGNSDCIAVSERSFVLLIENEGQSESKKSAKKLGPETKGTAMSFGFKKKIYTTSKKNGNSIKASEKLSQEEQFGPINTDNDCGDDNGNRGGVDVLSDRESGRTTPRLTPPRKESTGAPYRSIRFGFRQANVVRPASTGLNPKITNCDTAPNNNFTMKPRSKSECSPFRSTSANQANNKQASRGAVNRDNPKINACSTSTTVNITYQHLQQQQQQQHQSKNKNMPAMHQHQTKSANVLDYTNKPPNGRQQLTIVNTGMHTNEIVRPTPKPAEFVSKFTLHTSSLPQPQYPVPISLASRNVMDTKVAKHAANTTRRGFFAGRDISSDSGLSGMDSLGHVSPKRNRSRPRNLEMVINGRHKFEVRDLDDDLMDENVVPLSLPKLPSCFSSNSQPAPISGLHRNDESPSESCTDGINLSFRKSSLTSLNVESIEEEKLYRDNSMTEKGARNSTFKEYSPSSKTSSPASSRASWCNAGESMAIKDCSSISVSSSESVNNKDSDCKTLSVDLREEDTSMGMALDKTLSSSISPPTSLKIDTGILQHTFKNNINEELAVAIEDMKFAQITEAAGDDLIDDETSPIDSLMSSCDSDEIMTKKNKKKINDSIKEKDILDELPILDISCPLSPVSPTHASNSLSLSDGDVGRDFLIDDEIADQPALCFSDKREVEASNPQLFSLTDTPTLTEKGSCASKIHSQASKVHNNNSYAPQIKPRQSLLSRTESLDTLSPCESIASDDLMMDYDYNSSVDSLDRMSQSIHGSVSALHSLDHSQLLCELDAKGQNDTMKEWNSLFKTARMLNRDSMTSHLPARATRLLNRSRVQQSNAGSDSPRSLDSFHRRTSSNRPSPQMTRDSNGSLDDNISVQNESMRNVMLDDLLDFKKQLIRLRNVLQEPEGEDLTSTDTLNPFEINGQFYGSGELNNDIYIENKDLYNYSKAQDDAKQELLDLRRQSQIDDKDRTIKIQQNQIDKLEKDVVKLVSGTGPQPTQNVDTTNTATQTDRLRPLSIGQDGSSRLEDEDYAAKEPTNLPIKQTLTNGSSNQFSLKRMLYPSVKTMGTTVVTHHQSNIAPKSNGNVGNNHLQQPEKVISRRIPRLVRSPNVDDHNNNNNLLNDITSYKNGLNGYNNNNNNATNGKESHLKLLGHPNSLPNGDVNEKSPKLLRIRNSSILKSPNFRTRVTNGDFP